MVELGVIKYPLSSIQLAEDPLSQRQKEYFSEWHSIRYIDKMLADYGLLYSKEYPFFEERFKSLKKGDYDRLDYAYNGFHGYGYGNVTDKIQVICGYCGLVVQAEPSGQNGVSMDGVYDQKEPVKDKHYRMRPSCPFANCAFKPYSTLIVDTRLRNVHFH
jgi:hypothetical protein